MIDIPLGKALVPVEVEGHNCFGCCFITECRTGYEVDVLPCKLLCNSKNVIFWLVDWSGEEACND